MLLNYQYMNCMCIWCMLIEEKIVVVVSHSIKILEGSCFNEEEKKGDVLKKLHNHNILMIQYVVVTLGNDRHRLVIVYYLTILYSSSLCMLVGHWSSHVESTILMSTITSWFLWNKDIQVYKICTLKKILHRQTAEIYG